MTHQQPIALSFINAQSKPKVSSPAPSKIYGRPGRLSTDQIKIRSELSLCRAGNQPPDQPFNGIFLLLL